MFNTTLQIMSTLIGCKSESNYQTIHEPTIVAADPYEEINETCTPPNINFVIPQPPADATDAEKLLLSLARFNVARFLNNFNMAKNQANQANQQTGFTIYDHNSYPDSDEEAGAMALYGADMNYQLREYLKDGILYSNSFLLAWEPYGAYSFAYLPYNDPAFECGAYIDHINDEHGLMYTYRTDEDGTVSHHLNIHVNPSSIKVSMIKKTDGIGHSDDQDYEYGTRYALTPLNRGLKDKAQLTLDAALLLSTNSVSDVEVSDPPAWLEATAMRYGLYLRKF